MRIVLSGGGTAGHINPALALAETLKSRGHEVYFAGTPQGVEKDLVKQAGISFVSFDVSGFNRNHPTSIFKALVKMIKSSGKAKKWLTDIKPDVVVGFGAYVSIPVGRAASNLGIPLVIHEQNSVMGLANKYLCKKAHTLALTYEESAKGLDCGAKILVSGNPVRREVLEATASEGRSLLSIDEDSLVLLVFGGSLGARHINEAIVALKERLLAYKGLTIVHLTGQKEYESVIRNLKLTEEEAKRWKVFAYQDRMGEVLAAADIVVSRSGATSVAEISALHIPALLIPYPFATEDHQRTNAQAYVDKGAALMVADEDLDKDLFSEVLFSLIEKPAMRESMKEASANLVTEDAATRLADVVIAASQS